MSKTIETARAIIKNDIQLLKCSQKFMIPKSICDLNEKNNNNIDHNGFLRMSYRRFMRLRPLVSQRAMVRDTYVNYIRCKYRYEPPYLKSEFVLPENTKVRPLLNDDDKFQLRQKIYTSLQFILQAVTLEEISSDRQENNSKDILLAKQILKNILTVEYEKLKGDSERKWQYKKNNNPNNSGIIDYNIEFNHLKKWPRLNKEKENKYAAIKAFDECLVYLNKTLNTML